MPLAIKRTKRALKNKGLSDKDALGYVALTVKTDLGDQGAQSGTPTINIANLERMQVILGGAPKGDKNNE